MNWSDIGLVLTGVAAVVAAATQLVKAVSDLKRPKHHKQKR
jgi:hypothetical protein